MFEKLKQASERLSREMEEIPQVGILVGSGLGSFIERIQSPIIIPYNEIPHFPAAEVEGQIGRVILGKIGNTPIAALHGRLHCYDGHPMSEVVFPIRTLAALGIDTMILTSAVGAINNDLGPGDLVAITDHINLMGTNPLVGHEARELGPKFPNMQKAYSPQLLELLEKVAREQAIPLKKGVYVGVLGPTYETPAEVRMLRTLGADVVGMSTVPESIAANHLGIKVLGISCVTNMAAGIERPSEGPEAKKARALHTMELFGNLLSQTINKMTQI